jgi:hypothetical protein
MSKGMDGSYDDWQGEPIRVALDVVPDPSTDDPAGVGHPGG